MSRCKELIKVPTKLTCLIKKVRRKGDTNAHFYNLSELINKNCANFRKDYPCKQNLVIKRYSL